MQSQSSPVKQGSVWWLLIAGFLVSLATLWLTAIPLGIPGEWSWDRALPESDWLWNLLGGAIAAALFVTYILLGWQRLDSSQPRAASRLEIAAWLIGLSALGFVWLWIVQEVSPEKNRLGKAAFVLYFPGSSGYFTRARYQEPDSSRFLADYENLMRQGDVLHTGTHPPGLFLVFYGLISISQSPSPLADLLDATQPATFRDACNVIESNSVRSEKPLEFLPQDRRTLWLATLLVMMLASLTVVPLFGLLQRNATMSTAWLCAAMWPAIPAVAMFVPKSDVVFPFLAVSFTLSWLTAWDRRSVILAFLTGLIAWCGMICSLAFLPVFLATGILTLGSVWMTTTLNTDQNSATVTSEQSKRLRAKQIICVIAAFLGFAIATFAFWKSTHMNLLNVWWLNYRNHSGFYQQFTRTYWKWILVNPIELVFAVGFPVAILAIISCGNTWHRFCGQHQSLMRPDDKLLVASIGFVWGLLWLTGKNSGEAARLWILLMPWALWLASLQIDQLLAKTEPFGRRRIRATVLVAIQFASCLLTVSRVCGFHNDPG